MLAQNELGSPSLAVNVHANATESEGHNVPTQNPLPRNDALETGAEMFGVNIGNKKDV